MKTHSIDFYSPVRYSPDTYSKTITVTILSILGGIASAFVWGSFLAFFLIALPVSMGIYELKKYRAHELHGINYDQRDVIRGFNRLSAETQANFPTLLRDVRELDREGCQSVEDKFKGLRHAEEDRGKVSSQLNTTRRDLEKTADEVRENIQTDAFHLRELR